MSFGAIVTVLFLIIGKMAFAERPLLFMQRLPLGGHNYFDALSLYLLKLFGICISGIGTGNRTGLCQYFIGLVYLPGKLVDIAGIADRLSMHYQSVLIVNNALHIVACMAALHTVHNRAVGVGSIDCFPLR